MRRLLSVLFLICSMGAAFAASPSFGNFNSSQFDAQPTGPARVNIRSGVILTNITVPTEQIDTFAYIDGLGVIHSSGIPTNAVSGITINPTDGRIPYRSNATTFANSPWKVIDADTVGIGTNFTINVPQDGNTIVVDVANNPIALRSGSGGTVFTVLNGAIYAQPISTGITSSNVSFGAALQLNNTGNAVAGAPQWSPGLNWRGAGWSTNGAASRSVIFSSSVEPVNGANDPTGTWHLFSQVFGGGGSMTEAMSVKAASGYTGAGTKALTDDGTYKTFGTGTGDVTGPASATDQGIPEYSGTTGKLLTTSLLKITNGFHILPTTGTSSMPVDGTDNRGITLKQIRFIPTSTNMGFFTFDSGTGGANSDGLTYDETSNWGFNYRPFGGRYDNSLWSLKFGLESGFVSSDGTNYFEWNIDHTTAAGVGHRPFGMTINNGTGIATWQWAGTNFYFGGQQAGDPNRTIWTVTTNDGLSTYRFNGLVSASTSMAAGTIAQSQGAEYYRTATFPFPTSNFEYFTNGWNGTTWLMRTFANGSGTPNRPIQIASGTNTFLDLSADGTTISTCASTLFGSTNAGDFNLKTINGELYLTAQGSSKRVLISGSSAGTSVDILTGALKVSRASGTISLQANGANAYLAPTTATVTLLSDGMGALGQPGAWHSTDNQGTHIFYGTNNTQVLSLGVTGNLSLTKTITAAGTTGAQTINKTSGSVNFAASAESLVVTDSFVTANSIIICTVASNDTTMKSVAVVAAAGSFTMYPDAVPTSETRVNFLVTN